MTVDPLLSVESLTFQYRSRTEPAVIDVSFDLQPGEILLLAGASGCGKTTIARCVNGLIPRSYKGTCQGSVRLKGREVADIHLAEVSQIVGTLLQDPERQIVNSSVIGELAFGPENLGLPPYEIRRRIDEVIERMGIGPLRDRQTFTLSGGEKQKVALAGILVMQPSILLLDEPLASLDPASAREALAIFRRLADEGASIVLIEHRVEEALRARPDRLLYLKGGRVEYLGPVRDLLIEIDHREVKLPAPWVVERVRAADAARAWAAPQPSAAPSEPLVAFENVSFGYGDGPTVLHNIDLTIRRGDRVAILGPNGAGKSTLVKHAIGLLKPRQGRVLVAGVDSRRLSVAQTARTVGYVFQSPTHMLFAPTVVEELAFGPRNLGFDAVTIEASVRTSVDVTNLAGLEQHPPLGLSFGEQKRTTIAAVAAMRSRILIMDEPTAGQDYANCTRFMDALCAPPEGGSSSVLDTTFDATVFISHDLDLAVTYANRVVLLSQGRIVGDGPPEQVLADFERLERCRILPTSLLRLNCEMLKRTGRFLPAEALAAYPGA